ncbi:MAG: hypothetical protein AAAB13_02410 [Pseudomonas sp.]
MKTTDLLAIALRIFALFLLYTTFVTAIQQYQYIHQAANVSVPGDIRGLIVVGLGKVIGLLLMALAMLKFPMTLARRLAPPSDTEANTGGISAQELQSVAFCVLGVYLVARSIADFFNNGAWIIYMLRGTPAVQENLVAYSIQELITVIELLIGLLLCLKAEGLSQLIRRLRRAGTQ